MKRRTLLIALAACLVAVIGVGTLAYFQYEAGLTNYFAVAGVEDPTDPTETVEPEELFSVILEETDPEGGKTEEGNVYEDILPGTTVTKDPTVTNTGMYDAYVRVMVTVTDAADWKAACAKHNITDLTTIFGGYDEEKWDRGEIIDEGDTLTYIYYLDGALAPEASACLFETVTIPTAFDVDDMVSLSTFSLEITAQAIQAQNTGATAQEAFANWEN